jgi:hypothetical protein
LYRARGPNKPIAAAIADVDATVAGVPAGWADRGIEALMARKTY